MNDVDFSALLCSRLCHDLISPVGAIANGLEILVDENDEVMRAEVMKLLAQSAEATSARLKFYRLSFGSAGGFGEKVPLREAESAIKGLYLSGNIDLSWQSDIGGMNKDAMKIMLNMVLLAGESLFRGGEMCIEITEEAPTTRVMVKVRGDKIIFSDPIRKALLGELPDREIEAKTAPAFLAASAARKIGCKIQYMMQDEQSFSLHMSYQES